MNLKALVILGISVLSAAGIESLSAGNVGDQRKAELLLAIGQDSFERVDNLPVEEKQWLLEYIREKRKEPSLAGAYELQLIQLGDEEAMKRCLGVFDQYPGGSLYLSDSRQPRLIERMAPTMFHDEPSSFPQLEDVNVYPRSVAAASMVARVLSTSHEIPEPVRRWAKETEDAARERLDLHGKLRSTMRQWWKDNETAMRSRNWAAVKPGAPIIASAGSASPAPVIPVPDSPSPPPSHAQEPPGKFLSPAANESSSSSTGSTLYIIGGLLALLVLVVAVRFGRRRFR